ncbi:Glutathione S-transferase T2 [Glycine soja]
MKIFKIYRNMLCVHHHLLSVKILKIHHSILCIHHPHTCEPPTSGSSQNPQIYSQPSTPTNSNTCYRLSLSNIVLPSNEIESPVGVDGIQLDEGDENSSGKKSRTAFSVTEDVILIRSWLNVSKDSIIGVDQTSKQYWARIKNAYNNDDMRQSGQFCERSWTQLKSRWNKIHPPVQKFNGCYKQADKPRRSGSSEKDVLVDAHMIYSQDTGKKFEVEHAWLLLKDQSKFDAEFMSKTKVSTSGNYSSSSNPETPIEVEEYDRPSPMSRPIGQKAAKRKSKGKECHNTLNLSSIESEAQEKRLQEQERRMEYEILMKDISNMSEQQRKDHEKYYKELEDNSDEEIIRLILESQQQLHGNTTSQNPVYTEIQFRRRFRMQRHVFLRIVNARSNHDEYFQMRVDALRRKGLSPLQKCTTAIRILAYGSPANSVDEYVRIGICTIFGNEYLRRPNNEDIERLLQMGAERGFPGMLGSIDCMHWEWNNCPVAWKGQFCRGDHRNPTIILEAMASQDLWI